MDWWLIALALLVLLTLVAFVVPLDLAFSLQARGDPSGGFAAAGGAQLGPVAGTFVAATGVPARLDVRVFGRALKASKPERLPTSRKPKSSKVSRWAKEKLDWVELLDFLMDARRRLVLHSLDLGFEYSSRNVALTGRILAVLSALSGLLPEPVHLRHAPSWELVDRASLSVDGRIRFWPALFLWDTLWFLARTFMLPQKAAPKRS